MLHLLNSLPKILPKTEILSIKEEKAVWFYRILCVYIQITFVMINILHETGSRREELLLNLVVIQQNYCFCRIPILERLLSLNNKDKLLRSAICKTLPFWILTDKTFQPLKHTEHIDVTFYYRSITGYLSMMNSLESRFGFNFVGDK